METNYPKIAHGFVLEMNNLGNESLNTKVLDLIPDIKWEDELAEEIFLDGDMAEVLLLSYVHTPLKLKVELVVGLEIGDISLSLLVNVIDLHGGEDELVDSFTLISFSDLFYEKSENLIDAFYMHIAELIDDGVDEEFDVNAGLSPEERQELIKELENASDELEKHIQKGGK